MTITQILDSVLLPPLSLCLAIIAIVWCLKVASKWAGYRHHWLIERSIPTTAVLLGILLGYCAGGWFGFDALLGNGRGEAPPRGVYALLGVGAGLTSIGLYQWLLEYFPEDSAVRRTLKVCDHANNSNNGDTSDRGE